MDLLGLESGEKNKNININEKIDEKVNNNSYPLKKEFNKTDNNDINIDSDNNNKNDKNIKTENYNNEKNQNINFIELNISKKNNDNYNNINLIDKEEYDLYIREYKNFSLIYNELDSDNSNPQKNKNKNIETIVTKNENLSMDEALDEIEHEIKNSNDITNNIKSENNKNNNLDNITGKKHEKFKFILKGDKIIYNHRIFIYNKHSSQYKAKINRKIYKCQYYYIN